ncbi:MAG: septum formation protein Maf [Planctomycetes bacterium]|nr:septum formation protein Maf [Planctomycetota bacterium]
MSRVVQPPSLILASTSPRRAELLRTAGYQFEVVAPPMVEPDELHPHVDPGSYAESLAYFKASSIADRFPSAAILGADTIAYVDGEIIGKPEDRDDARRILTKLSATTHKVVTGIALVHPATDRRIIAHDVSMIRCRPLSDAMIAAYLDTNQWQGKAGAYGIQDSNDPFVECLEGSFSNVVGLPMELLARVFAEWRV